MSTNLFQQLHGSTAHWLISNIDYFNPSIKRKEINENIQFKCFIELLFITNMFPNEECFSHSQNEQIFNVVKDATNKIDFNSIVEKDGTKISGLTELIKYGRNHGDPSLFLSKKKAQSLVNQGLDVLPDKTPFRLLDTFYSVESAGLRSNFKDKRKIYEKTALAKNSNLFYMTDNLAYSITHTIFYITAMGTEIPKYLDIERTRETLFLLISYYLSKNNYDISGEALLCLNFLQIHLNNNEKKVILSAFQKIQSAQNGQEIIPSPDTKISGDNKTDFFSNYHTTMVIMGAAYSYAKQKEYYYK